MDKLKKLMELLKGKKTFILAALGGAVVAAKLAGLIEPGMADSLLALLGFGSMAALRASK